MNLARKPLFWIAVGGGAATVVLIAKKASGAPQVAQSPSSTTYGETARVTLAVPSGWRRVTNAEVAALPELGAQANALRNTQGFTSMAYGTLSPFQASDGRTYATWIEQHYHEPGGSLRPWGLHHGVTLLTRADAPLALSDGWR